MMCVINGARHKVKNDTHDSKGIELDWNVNVMRLFSAAETDGCMATIKSKGCAKSSKIWGQVR